MPRAAWPKRGVKGLFERIVQVVCLASLIAGALWLQSHGPAQARARNTGTAQDIVGKLELTVRGRVTGHYSPCFSVRTSTAAG